MRISVCNLTIDVHLSIQLRTYIHAFTLTNNKLNSQCVDTRQRSGIFLCNFIATCSLRFLITQPLFLIGIVKLGFIKSTCPLHGHHHNCFCQNARLCRLHALSQLDDASSLELNYLNSLTSNEIIKHK